ncbi:EcsC family protein [Luteipulveratus flavus]|uniref:EcsC family protein n=1 Tax=Luteipulveratus flavus TaxID=3031728 RepID=A0ABT6C461_9MICO|nr:EcsC family protein [Luteipulveratus sp. YIM 133296]MDF8263734.1 EcsC family protein [Luteipulveratus sp. YIM 133296]
MNDYDRKAWDAVQEARRKREARSPRHLLPKSARHRMAAAGAAARDRVGSMPGADEFGRAMAHAVEGLVGTVTRAGESTLRKTSVVSAFQQDGHQHVERVRDIRKLELEQIDDVKPALDLRYAAWGLSTGATAGAAVTTTQAAAAAGTVASGGLATAPAAAVVVTAISADAAAVLGGTSRLIAQTAAYYGYDVDRPEERIYALGVMGYCMSGQGAKNAAYVELTKLSQALARNATWKQLNQSQVTQIIQAVFHRLGIRLTKKKLGQAVPVVSVVIGAGMNAASLMNAATDADLLYRERFLREKYDLPPAHVPQADDARRQPEDQDDHLSVLAILEDETADARAVEDADLSVR